MIPLALLLGALAATGTLGEAAGPEHSTPPLGFADHLFATGDYYRAIGEYKRYLFESPDGPLAAQARERIGLSYLDGGREAEAAVFFEALAAGSRDAHERLLANFDAANARYRQGEREAASDDFHRLLTLPDLPEPLRDRASYLLGWSLLLDRRPAEAEAAFRAVGSGSPLAATARDLLPVIAEADQLPHRSPLLAGLLSVLVPGAGYFYLGEPGTGLAALGWNGLFGFGVYDAAVHKLYGVTAVLTVFEAMWYGGAIFGSVSGAHKFNRDAWLNYTDELKARFDWKGEGSEGATAPPAP